MTYTTRKFFIASIAAVFVLAAAIFCTPIFRPVQTAEAAGPTDTVHWGLSRIEGSDEYKLVISDDANHMETKKETFSSEDSYTKAGQAPWFTLKTSEPETFEKITSVLVTGGYYNVTQPTPDTLPKWHPTMMSFWFSGMTNLKYIDISYVKTTGSTRNLFSGCTGLVGTVGADGTAIKLGSMAMTGKTWLDGMFDGCENITEVDLSSFQKGSDFWLDKTDRMFKDCKNLKSIEFGEGFQTNEHYQTNHTATAMFQGCSSLTSLDLSKFDFSKLKASNATDILKGCDSLQTIAAPSKMNAVALPLPAKFEYTGESGVVVINSIASEHAGKALTRHAHSGSATCATPSPCDVCGESYYGDHSYDDGEVTTEPTCSATGIKTKTCSACGDVRTETVDIDENAHSYDDGVITTEPTCTVEGVKTFTCSHDPTHTKTEPVAALGHSYGEWETVKAPTCSATGSKTKTCSTCGDVQTETVDIDENAHSYDAGVITTEPTDTADGVKTFTCLHNPEHTKTEPIPALGVKVTVTVTNGEIEGVVEHSVTVNKDASVTVIASKVDGKKFKGWSADGGETILSPDAVYTFHATESMSLTAIYDSAEEPGGGLPTGAIIGISVGGGILLLLTVYVTMYFLLYRRGKLKGKFWDVFYAPMNAIFDKKNNKEHS